MQSASIPLLRDLVLVGGGHAHALVLRMWAMQPLAGVRLTLISPDPVTPYTGMLPGHIAGHYSQSDMMVDLVRLARFAGARLILDHATGLDRAARRLHLHGRPAMEYDVLSLDIGIGSDLPQLAGFADHAVSAKPLAGYADQWQSFVSRALPRPRLVILGAGVGGVELALASAHRLRSGGAVPEITLIDHGPTALPRIGGGARAHLLDELDRAGVRLLLNTRVRSAEAGAVVLADGRRLPSDLTLTVTGARPHGWLTETGLALTDGFIDVGPQLQSSDPLVFATGDCATMTHAPRPKAGVFAVRQAPVLLHNLRAVLTGTTLRAYHPQRDYLKLVSLGDRRAVADKFGLRAGGAWLWRIKDRIDRRFMARFADFPPMPASPMPRPAIAGLAEALTAQPQCAGCGSKLGGADLAAALRVLPAPRRADVLSGRGDDAAILRNAAGTGVQVLTTDHLRAFTPDARLMARVAAVHALGDIWAMGAAAQVALAQITLPRLSDRMQAAMLVDIMQAAAEVFGEAGADVVGGHTSVGVDLTIGFTVTGTADRAIAKGGAQPGDALILAKPLGSGTVMAAEMAMTRLPGLLLGSAVAATLQAMCQPQAEASRLLAPHARAMTDVTGFGLAGHLIEMLDASEFGARISLAALPLLPGAEALAEAGVASSLAPANRAAVLGRVTGPVTPRTALLYDPQTCGGLLAAVPADQADRLLADLRRAGYAAARIGGITAGPPQVVTTD